MAQITKGRWHTDGVNVKAGKWTVAIAYDPDRPAHTTPTALANARAIANVPNMLELIRIISQHVSNKDLEPAIPIARNIIREIKG